MPLIWKEQSILKRLKLQFQRTPSDSATNFKSENEHIEYVNAHLNIFTLVALQNRLKIRIPYTWLHFIAKVIVKIVLFFVLQGMPLIYLEV